MGTIGPLEIGIILLIVVLLFGVGRIGKIGGELGKGIKEFRNAVKDGEDDKPAEKTETK
ncbi:MAG TPA: twin-arginine translocase TatA/TatE family subunit [Thermoflexales bacterium]|nr:twin-arginine translocase TatA/TatE family subunit [Thermoflexales bacterium]HQX74968.1 twin-arginine translocase TatA/TatE family subunit [Thermoflexales bacterium]HQZ23515.1 twin-arginine translocase TatA/TatE family subunit [Thermoflexales bacterium]HQZ99744.1 twin-arginine translocase TatA/TatE family subunit [Thermoflexales bacterium]